LKALVRATPIKARDLKPGDLFSTAGPDYWDTALNDLSVGERVYIRTNAPTPPEQADIDVYLITIDQSDWSAGLVRGSLTPSTGLHNPAKAPAHRETAQRQTEMANERAAFQKWREEENL